MKVVVVYDVREKTMVITHSACIHREEDFESLLKLIEEITGESFI